MLLLKMQVFKRFVDSYEQGKIVPRCQFSANIMYKNGAAVMPLLHKVKLNGTKSPDDFLRFNIIPQVLMSGI